ncbi:MAG: undecaprenyldiphospho-muramoylpentapeptide beta-N-acetylglucosaminyltransferase [Treponema sp.]|jgi:UDP-N-acetylglucosamine--N-acetylmuramyl-(pentapeptide) pyrophosphoryl-undecaprenol N-acetylglucosamine transferase|nr:undecaprenyldiphospho-muramoylpentapeptide beta-N-acetylglucosaminyltransferase [Treponema sp.]
MVSLAFTGGGTGGHIYPGLAIASYLKKNPACRVFWIGSNEGMDRAIVEEAGLEFFGIPSGKFRRYFSLKNFSDIFKICAGYFAAKKILKKEKPALLFSKGGYVSVPPAAAAASLKIPVFAHESDFSPGLATKINLRFVEKLFIPYKESETFFSPKVRGRLDVSGNPVRPEFRSADAGKGRAFLNINEGEPILLVLGGSSGSLEINSLIEKSLPVLAGRYTVVHQTGSNSGGIKEAGPRYKPYAYFREELPHIIAAAELVVCRGGAGTIWECAAIGKPMIIIPLQGTGTRGDQVENARLFEKAGAAINLCDDPSPENLSRVVTGLSDDAEKRKAMSASSVSGIFAAEYIAGIIMRKAGVQ